MSRTHAEFDQFYECGDKKFVNLWQAFDYQLESQHFPYYRPDKDFIDAITNCKRPNKISHQYIKDLIVKSLKHLRQKHKYLRIALGGGTDSWSILKYCVQSDIYVDEVVTSMLTFAPNVRHNLEWLPALRYAEEHVGKSIGHINKVYPRIDDCFYVKEKNWWSNPDYVRGSHWPIRPCLNKVWLERTNLPEDDRVDIFGYEKPYIKKQNNKMYWVLQDDAVTECMGIKSVVPLFYNKEFPELTVAMAYAFADNCTYHANYYSYENFNKNKLKVLNDLGLESTGHRFLDMFFLGKSDYDGSERKLGGYGLQSLSSNYNYKSKMWWKFLEKIGREDLIEDYKKSVLQASYRYKDLPYALQSNGNSLERVGRQICIEMDEKGFGNLKK